MSAVAIKVGILAIKSISKPISKKIKDYAQDHKQFKTWCGSIGNFFNSITHKVNVRIAGGKQIKLKPLAEAEAVSIGADYVGEGFVLSVSVGLLVAEYARRDYIKDIEKKEKIKQKEKKREKKEKEFDALLEHIKVRFSKLDAEVSVLKTKIQELKGTNENVDVIPSVKSDEKDSNSKNINYNETQKQENGWFSSWFYNPFYVKVIDAKVSKETDV